MYFIFQKGWCSYTNISDQREHLPSPGPQHSPMPDAYRSVGAGEAHGVFSPDYNLQKSAVLWPRASTAFSSFFFISTSFWKSTAPGSEDPHHVACELQRGTSEPEWCPPPGPGKDKGLFLVNLTSPSRLTCILFPSTLFSMLENHSLFGEWKKKPKKNPLII